MDTTGSLIAENDTDEQREFANFSSKKFQKTLDRDRESCKEENSQVYRKNRWYSLFR